MDAATLFYNKKIVLPYYHGQAEPNQNIAPGLVPVIVNGYWF